MKRDISVTYDYVTLHDDMTRHVTYERLTNLQAKASAVTNLQAKTSAVTNLQAKTSAVTNLQAKTSAVANTITTDMHPTANDQRGTVDKQIYIRVSADMW